MNALLGAKLAIVSSKPQTTRTRIMGVLTKGPDQYVFIDTPGLHRPRTRLGDYMVKAVNESVSGVDACVLVVEPEGELTESEHDLIRSFEKDKVPAILVINKIDLLENKERLLARIAQLTALYPFDAVLPVSALTGEGVEDVVPELSKYTVECPHFFDDDAVIYCEKESHKGIIIGKRGAMLKEAASRARADMEDFFGTRINLQCWVKVKEDWRNRQGLLRSFGFDERG